ncbi:rab2a member ras oncogene family [Anaeramoeba flamelloides]|uniref:Rab2a member ras oncogene family n=1 Tax=Anaeramoeba flamelloides TaxID=1746091 RepID=A0AAV7YGQ4_9EUKA|nr:rab2a member ras oncogene family [Anaeramoeba flamelloides]
MESNLFLKYIIIGDSGVGKTSLLNRFTTNEFIPSHEPTIGVQFATKNLELFGKKIKLQIWDTAGQESYRSITRSFYRGALCALLVYDVTQKKTFSGLENWLHDLLTYSRSEIQIILVGNKADLDYRREISYEEGDYFAKKNNLLFLESSAKSNFHVSDISWLFMASIKYSGKYLKIGKTH